MRHACFSCFYRGLYFHEFIRNLLWVRLRDKGLLIHLSLRNYFDYFERFCAWTTLIRFYQQGHASYLCEPSRPSMLESPLNLDTKTRFFVPYAHTTSYFSFKPLGKQIEKYLFVYFFGGLEGVGCIPLFILPNSLFRDVWIRTHRASVAKRRASKL